MTRINLVPPQELMDQHLLAEIREIHHVPASLRRSLKSRGAKNVLDNIPPHFTLNTGHVTFFYNKLLYLEERYSLLVNEWKLRGFDKIVKPFDVNFDDVFKQSYVPTPEALMIIRQRINERIALKPDWYRKT